MGQSSFFLLAAIVVGIGGGYGAARKPRPFTNDRAKRRTRADLCCELVATDPQSGAANAYRSRVDL
jgi:hypothetical protein